jgi:hypothetical protein
LDYPEALETLAFGINDAGSIAGYYIDRAGLTHGFTYIGGVFTPVDVPGATATMIYRINNKNNVVGMVLDSLGELHGVIGH